MLVFVFYVLMPVYNLAVGIFLAIYILSVIYTASNIFFLVMPVATKTVIIKHRMFTVYLGGNILALTTFIDTISLAVHGPSVIANYNGLVAVFYMLIMFFCAAVCFQASTYFFLIWKISAVVRI